MEFIRNGLNTMIHFTRHLSVVLLDVMLYAMTASVKASSCVALQGVAVGEVFSPEEILESHRFHVWNLHLLHVVSQPSIEHGKEH